ncbi:MAG: dehydrogenase, partial [Bradyrhizobium sp.]
VLRSGWEFEIPLHSIGFKYEDLFEGYNNSPHTIFSGFRIALDWLAAGRMKIEGQTTKVDPSDPASVYRDLAARKVDGLFAVFDWGQLRPAA